MDKLPLHLQKNIAQHLSIDDIQACFLAHRSFHEMLHEMTYYDGWTLISSNLKQRLESLKRYMPCLKHLEIHVQEITPIPHKLFAQLVDVAMQIELSLSIYNNIALLDKLRKRQLPLKITFLETTQQQVNILDFYSIKVLEIQLHHGPFSIAKLTTYPHFKGIKHLTIHNFNEQHATFAKEELVPFETIPSFHLYTRGNISLLSYPLLERCTALAGVSLTTFATLSNKNLKEIILNALESHLMIYHFELPYFLNQTSHECTLCIKQDALTRAEIAILAKLFLETSTTRKVVLEVSDRAYDRQQDLCANLIYLRLGVHEPRVYLANSRYSEKITLDELLDELKKLDVIAYYTWKSF